MSRIFTPEGYPEIGPAYLSSASFLDSGHPAVKSYALGATQGARDDIERAVRLYYAVRDGIRYDPYAISLDEKEYRASTVLGREAAYCIPKAVLLAAAARAVGIPSAIGLSDVRNHFTSKRLAERMGDCTLFLHHGYALLFLDGKWVKAAPAFNIELCEKFGTKSTEFDGRENALLQEYDAKNRRTMEYVRNHGVWSDLPYERIAADFRDYYPPAFYGAGSIVETFGDDARSAS